MRSVFSSDDKRLPFPFYKMVINVPSSWIVRDAIYPNRIDLSQSQSSKHIKIWFKALSDNDDFILDKERRQTSYQDRISEDSSCKLILPKKRSFENKHLTDNVVYLEYSDNDNNEGGICSWFSMVYKNNYEVQIALTRGSMQTESVRSDFNWVIDNIEITNEKSEQEKFAEKRRFHEDAAAGRLENIIKHIENKVDLNSRNPSGGTALMIAAKRGNLKVVRALLEAGADPNIGMYKVYVTAMHTAAEQGFDDIIRELIKHGAKVDAKTSNGETPLMAAAYYCRTSTVKLLIEIGASIEIKDNSGKTAYRWAKKNRCKETAPLLKGNQKDENFLSKLASFFRRLFGR